MNNELIMALSKAHAVWGPLGHLRGNRPERTLELLEVNLDGAIIWLHRLTETLGPEEREHALGTLRGIRDYRRAHPRRTEIDLSTLDQKTVADSLKLQDQARKILNELK